jgi:hypothetical protein
MIKISGFLWLMLVLVLPSGAQDFSMMQESPDRPIASIGSTVPRAPIGRTSSKSVEKISLTGVAGYLEIALIAIAYKSNNR